MTPLQTVYDSFFNIVTDDFYNELITSEVNDDCKAILLASIPLFEFPKQPLNIVLDVNGEEIFDRILTLEEVNILAFGMVQIWAQRQVSTIEMTRQKFSGADFKITSQAAHLQRLLALLESTKTEHRRLQMLYSRRRDNGIGGYETTFDLLVTPTKPKNIERRGVSKRK